MSKLTQAIDPPTLVEPAGRSRVAGQVAVTMVD